MRVEHWVYTVPLRLRSLLRRRQVERELDEELRYHVERQTEELVARGVPSDEARAAALRAMGGVERRKDECRDARRVGVAEDLARDARYAVRSLRRSPGFTATAVLTLTLGLGATIAIFSAVNGVLLRPLPYADPDRLVTVSYGRGSTVAAGTFLDWKSASRSFERMGVEEYWTPSLTGREKAEELLAVRVSADILPLLGVPPLLGRAFLPEEEHAGRDRVVVLTHESWRRRFAGDPRVVGQTMLLDGAPHTVVGVMPPGFRFAPYWATEAELAAPLVLDHRREDRQGSSLRSFSRLRPGVTLAQARGEMAAIAARLEREYPGQNQGVTVTPLREEEVGDVRPALLILLAAVAFVLLIACATVAHLQLVRAAARERELAVRTALGASRGRLVQQSLVESAMLSAVGGALGLALAYGGVRLLVALAPPGVPRLDAVGIDARVGAFAAAATLLSALVFGAAPALIASRVNVHAGLKEGSRSAADSVRRRRIRGALVASEFAMALVLLVGAGLVLRSFAALMREDAGFERRRILSLRVSVRGTQHADLARRPAFFRELVERVGALPGVEAASAINHLPMWGDHWRFPFFVEGRPVPPPGEDNLATFRIVRPGYFRTMRIPIVRGRDFTAEDEAAGAHVIVINETMARRHWPNDDAIGKRLSVDGRSAPPDWFTVIGVVRDVKQGSWSEPPSEEMYFPHLRTEKDPGPPLRLADFLSPDYMTLVVRTSADPAALTRAVEGVVLAMDRGAPISGVTTMEQVITRQVVQPRFYLLLLGAFAGVALVLAAVGVYGVISYSVARRTHEIGLRLALGARRSDPFRLVVRQGMRLAALGAALGLAGALAVTRYLRSLLFGVQPTDPATFAVVTLLLAAVAFVACCVPAWRASRVDPVVALRAE